MEILSQSGISVTINILYYDNVMHDEHMSLQSLRTWQNLDPLTAFFTVLQSIPAERIL